MGRPSLLPSQPNQSGAAPGERDRVSHRLRAAVRRHRRARRCSPGWWRCPRGRSATSSSNPGDTTGEPGHARAQGRHQGGVQPAAKGRASVDLGALAARCSLVDPTLFGLFPGPATAGGASRQRVSRMAASRVSARWSFERCSCSSFATFKPGLVWATKIVTDPIHDVMLYHKSPIYLLRGELDRPTVSREVA